MLISETILSFLCGHELKKGHMLPGALVGEFKLHLTCSILALVSGLFNMIVTRPKTTMGDKHKPWSTVVKIKFFLVLLLTPLPVCFVSCVYCVCM